MARTKPRKRQLRSSSKNSSKRLKLMRECKKRPPIAKITLKTTSWRPTKKTRRPGNSLMSPNQPTTASNAASHRRVGPQKNKLPERLQPKTQQKKQLLKQRLQQHKLQHKKRSSRPLPELILTNKPLQGQSHSCPLARRQLQEGVSRKSRSKISLKGQTTLDDLLAIAHSITQMKSLRKSMILRIIRLKFRAQKLNSRKNFSQSRTRVMT